MTTDQTPKKQVLPQEVLNAKPEQLISWFDDLGTGNEDHSFLSNFHAGEPLFIQGVSFLDAARASYPDLSDSILVDILDDILPFEFEGSDLSLEIGWSTNEHFFAAMKAWGSDLEAFVKMALATDPNVVKSIGRRCKLRSDWEQVKTDVMMAGLREKFSPGREEATLLLATNDALLIEGTFWQDDVWGVALKDEDPLTSPGRNWLGTLLMAVRAEVKVHSKFGLESDAGYYNAVFATSSDHRAAWDKRG